KFFIVAISSMLQNGCDSLTTLHCGDAWNPYGHTSNQMSNTSITFISTPMSMPVYSVVHVCPKLTFLNMQNSAASKNDYGVECLKRHCPNLSVLYLSYCVSTMTSMALNYVSINCPSLTYIDLSGSPSVATVDGIAYLTSRCKKLCTIVGVDGKMLPGYGGTE